MVAREADTSIAMEELPVLMIYQDGDSKETIVEVAKQLNSEFTLENVDKFIQLTLDKFRA